MTDYISRQAAIEAVEEGQQYKVSKEDYAVDFAEVKTALMLLPSADVRENVRGEWKIYCDNKGVLQDCYCDQCGFNSVIGGYFCPNCGADMRGEA